MRSDYKVQLQGAIGRCNWTIFHSQLHVVFRLLNQLVPLQLLHLGKPLPFVVPLILSEQRALFAVESLNLPPTAIEDSSCEFQLRVAIARCDWKLQLPVQMAVVHRFIAPVALTPQVPHLIWTLDTRKWLAVLTPRTSPWLDMTPLPIPPSEMRFSTNDLIAGFTAPNWILQSHLAITPCNHTLQSHLAIALTFPKLYFHTSS
jgi:hypothetical protein